MTDVSKINGPSGPNESSGKRDQKSIDAAKFKETLRRRVDEVSQTDPDEQKKRKRQQEEEDLVSETEPPLTPPGYVTPFSLEESKKGVSPLEKQSPGKEIPASQSSRLPKESKEHPDQTFVHFTPPPSEEIENSSGLQDSAKESFSSSENPLPQSRENFFEPESNQIPQENPPQYPSATSPVQRTQPSETREQKKISPSKQPTRRAENLQSHAPALEKKEETSGFFEQMGKEKGSSTPVEKQKKAEEAINFEGTIPFNSHLSIDQTMKEEEGEKNKVEENSETIVPETTPQLIQDQALHALQPLPSYTHLPPQVMDLFDRMVGVMTVMQHSGIEETTFTLNSSQFASSVFFGSQIIIKEYSTAPKAFNIQINGTPQAVALFEKNANNLMAAFQQGNFGYRVNRLQTGYLEEKEEKPLFKRKESISGDNQDQTGPGP